MKNGYKEVEAVQASRLEFKKGQEGEFILVGRRKVEGIKTQYGPKDTMFYDLVDLNGELFSLIGQNELDQKLKAVPDNTPIYLAYHGKVMGESLGGEKRLMHKWTVGAKLSGKTAGKASKA